MEACINAVDHSKGEDDKIYLNFELIGERMEISIESSGREFVSQETGEPFVGRALKEDSDRGWGIKLMSRFADSVGFEKTERGTKVILVKNILKKSTIDNKDTTASE
ncbi:MAG: ATP-binding protein [Thermodesulfovibrionales bacterium]|nr:ATP-binding protein [Thermodesulfovibrionales bacterium]